MILPGPGETAFLAMSLALGEPVEAIDAALGTDGAWARNPRLRTGSREARARALAAAIAPILTALDGMVLA